MSTTMHRAAVASDAQLVRAARAGDSASLGELLQRHRPALYASAVAMLGQGHQAQDAVQDSCVTALRRLPELRDASAFGGWLHAIGRTTCLMELRRRRREILVADPPEAADDEDPLAAVEEEIDRHALRGWVWGVLDELPESQRLTVMLRYFGRERRYEEIAQICAVPVGTVRSRLNSARTTLAERLLDAAMPDEPMGESADGWRVRLAEALEAINQGDPAPAEELFAPGALITAGRVVGGTRVVLPELLRDSDDGVRVHTASVVAGAGIVVLDGEIDNPPGDPEHCPPAFTWVAFHDGSRISRLRFHHAHRSQ